MRAHAVSRSVGIARRPRAGFTAALGRGEGGEGGGAGATAAAAAGGAIAAAVAATGRGTAVGDRGRGCRRRSGWLCD